MYKLIILRKGVDPVVLERSDEIITHFARELVQETYYEDLPPHIERFLESLSIHNDAKGLGKGNMNKISPKMLELGLNAIVQYDETRSAQATREFFDSKNINECESVQAVEVYSNQLLNLCEKVEEMPSVDSVTSVRTNNRTKVAMGVAGLTITAIAVPPVIALAAGAGLVMGIGSYIGIRRVMQNINNNNNNHRGDLPSEIEQVEEEDTSISPILIGGNANQTSWALGEEIEVLPGNSLRYTPSYLYEHALSKLNALEEEISTRRLSEKSMAIEIANLRKLVMKQKQSQKRDEIVNINGDAIENGY